MEGYTYSWAFGGNCAQLNYASGCMPLVTTWSWIQVLSAPVVSASTLIFLAFLAYLLDRRSKRREMQRDDRIRDLAQEREDTLRQVAEDKENRREREHAFDAYINNAKVDIINAHWQTLQIETMVVLTRISNKEKYFVAVLLLGNSLVIDGATLIFVSGLDFSGINLSSCTEALTNLNLRKGNFSDACFDGQDLYGSDLSGSNLINATFKETILDKVNLKDAQYNPEALNVAKSLRGTILADGYRNSGKTLDVRP